MMRYKDITVTTSFIHSFILGLNFARKKALCDFLFQIKMLNSDRRRICSLHYSRLRVYSSLT